ncbi:MAG: hypothetical protein E6G94_04955 [Alphaproteobacteria bacterium]|nr:MAG: hypothetical protein E6G94_04955 [Alphaproteobacteria bacterium]
MPDDVPDWSTNAVLDRLAAGKSPASQVSVQLFLSEDVGPEDLAEFVGRAAAQAAERLGIAGDEVRLGPAFKLARSVGITAPLAVIRELMSRNEFVNLLPSDLDDFMIKPVRRKP